jgi:hypothetical protein
MSTTTYANVLQQIGDDWVDALNRTGEAASKLADEAQKAGAGFVKELPTQLSLSEHVAKLNETLAAGLPEPTEVIEANYQLVQRLATAHRDLAIRLTEVSSRKDVPSPKNVSSRKDG